MVSRTPPCPICHKEVAVRSQNRHFPFCSDRCKHVDLGKWLGDEYRVPDRGVDEQEDEGPPDPGGK